MASPTFFEDFQPTTKADWLAKITKDLRGKPLDDLNWQLDQDLTLEAVFHPEDQPRPLPPIDMNKTDGNNWEVGALLPVSDAKSANTAALTALNGGVESLLFHLTDAPALDALLRDINLPYISVQFEGLPDLAAGAAVLDALQAHPAFRAGINGGLYLSPAQGDAASWQALLQKGAATGQTFAVCTIDGRADFAGTAHIPAILSDLLLHAHEWLATQIESGTAGEQAATHLQFAVSIGTSFFVEIAKLRALRLLWANVLDAYRLTTPMQLDVHPVMPAGETDPHTNMIRASTQALAAAIGGCNRLYLPPATQHTDKEATDFHYRIARNVQHLLKMESYLDRVIDPAAGSYYIEALTIRIAEQAWDLFQQKV
jgi:methylmalonyl-CoA mutase